MEFHPLSHKVKSFSTILLFAAFIISSGLGLADVLPGSDGDVNPGFEGDVMPGSEGDVIPSSDGNVLPGSDGLSD